MNPGQRWQLKQHRIRCSQLMEVKRTVLSVVICITLCLSSVQYYTSSKYTYGVTVAHKQKSLYSSNDSRCSCIVFGNRTKRETLHGIGNRLFYYSAIMYVAWLTGRRPCVWTTSSHMALSKVFDIHISPVDRKYTGCPLYTFRQRLIGVYDRRVESLVNVSQNTSMLLQGYFQSWMYVEPVAMHLRQHLRFRQELTQFVADFLSRSIPSDWSKLKFVRVGVHVRRGDFLRKFHLSAGFTVANERYLRKAMSYFVNRFSRVQFVVVSDDIGWCQKHVKLSTFNKTNVKITFSLKHSPGQDFALLASCDHTVMTTGSFSWWAAWLANGTTVYYANFPKHGSKLSKLFRPREYYRPNWIGINDDNNS